MWPDDFNDYIHSVPFVPFRITLVNGTFHDIKHPDMCAVGRTTVVIGLPTPPSAVPTVARTVKVALQHVLQLESLPLAGG